MNPAPRSGLDRLRPRTLRAKLTWGLVALLALSCATVGLTSVFALRGYLTRQIDHQLADSGCLFPPRCSNPRTSSRSRSRTTTTGIRRPTPVGRRSAPSAHG